MSLNSLLTVANEDHDLETQLRRSERELADFFDNGVVALQWVGPDGHILRVNQAQLELLGYSREEYLGRHIAEFYPDQDVFADLSRRRIGCLPAPGREPKKTQAKARRRMPRPPQSV